LFRHQDEEHKTRRFRPRNELFGFSRETERLRGLEVVELPTELPGDRTAQPNYFGARSRSYDVTTHGRSPARQNRTPSDQRDNVAHFSHLNGNPAAITIRGEVTILWHPHKFSCFVDNGELKLWLHGEGLRSMAVDFAELAIDLQTGTLLGFAFAFAFAFAERRYKASSSTGHRFRHTS
jgi:hypothetical protein